MENQALPPPDGFMITEVFNAIRALLEVANRESAVNAMHQLHELPFECELCGENNMFCATFACSWNTVHLVCVACIRKVQPIREALPNLPNRVNRSHCVVR